MNSKSMKAVKTIFTAAFLCLVFCGSIVAQEITANIVGTVNDANGAAIPGATVTLTDPSKSDLVVRTATTNDSGEFSFPAIPVGTYSVTVEAANFKKGVQTGIKVDVGARRAVDISLEAGNISETVTVSADAVAVELSTPTVGTTINGDQVREIPINNRNFVQLIALAPGVSNDLADQVYVGTTNPDGQANTINISVNGARSSQNTFTVDGADITDRGSNITIQAYPSVDSIGEVRILRSLYPAEAGRSGGGQINVVTRSGGRRFSGSAFEFVRNEVFNANSFLNNTVTNPPLGREDNGKAKRVPFRYNNFGWTLGGPIYFLKLGEKDPGDSYFGRWSRTFFFFSQEFRRDSRSTNPLTTTVPDAALRNGIFPIDVCINRNNVPAENCNVGNVGRLTAGQAIPANMINPVALAYLNGIYRNLPLPNTTVPYTLISQLPNKADFQQEILKIDHSFSDQVSMYYRYERDKIPTIDGNSLFSSGTSLPDVSTTSTNSPGRTHTMQVTYAPTSKFIIEGRYNFGYGAILSENVGLLALTRTTVPITMPYVNERDRVPSVSGNGFTGLGSFGPYDNFSWKQNLTGNFTVIEGSHVMKFGVVYSKYRKNENALAGNNEGNFTVFPSTLPALPPPPGGNSATNLNLQRWANFLVGNASTFTQASFDYTADLRQMAFEGFAQDEWRARKNLTLYLGVRYSFFGSPWDRNGRLSNFDPSLFNPANAPQVTGIGNRISGVAGVNTGNWCNGIIVNTQNFITPPAAFNCTATPSPYGKFVINAPKKDFAPRVGLAWDPFGKGMTSLRMGYGIYHEQVLNGTFLQNIGVNPPFQQTASLTGNLRLDNPGGNLVIGAAVPGLRAVDPNWKTPYMQHWSLDLQHQFGAKTIVSVGYYGSKATHLIGLTEINSIKPGTAGSSQCAVNTAYYAQTPAPALVACKPNGYAFRNVATAPGNPNGAATDLLILDQIRPFKGYRSIAMVQPRYGSNYHSMQVSAQHRLTGSSQLNMGYTWAKNLTNSQNDRTASPVDSYNIDAEWARAALDRRHVFNFNYVYELPWFSAQKGFAGKLLGGWQAGGIVNYQTGLGFTAVTSNLDYAGLGIINANPTARPNQICDPNQNAPHTFEVWYNINCFARNPTNTDGSLQQNTPGNAARNTIHGPRTFRVDFTMSKNLKFGEHYRLQLRGEVFNIFNTTNFRSFSSLNVLTGGANEGRIGVVRDPRTMQFGAKFSF